MPAAGPAHLPTVLLLDAAHVSLAPRLNKRSDLFLFDEPQNVVGSISAFLDEKSSTPLLTSISAAKRSQCRSRQPLPCRTAANLPLALSRHWPGQRRRSRAALPRVDSCVLAFLGFRSLGQTFPVAALTLDRGGGRAPRDVAADRLDTHFGLRVGHREHHRSGSAASGPMSPNPNTAVPSEITATALPLMFRDQALSISSWRAMLTRATPGVQAIERSSRVLIGILPITWILPPRCIRKVRSETLSQNTPSSAQHRDAVARRRPDASDRRCPRSRPKGHLFLRPGCKMNVVGCHGRRLGVSQRPPPLPALRTPVWRPLSPGARISGFCPWSLSATRP